MSDGSITLSFVFTSGLHLYCTFIKACITISKLHCYSYSLNQQTVVHQEDFSLTGSASNIMVSIWVTTNAERMMFPTQADVVEALKYRKL